MSKTLHSDTRNGTYIDIDNKLQIIAKLESGCRPADLAKTFHLSIYNVNKIWRMKPVILNQAVKNGRNLEYTALEKSLLRWCNSQTAQLTDDILMEKSREILRQSGTEYLCTRFWLKKFKSRYRVTTRNCQSRKSSSGENGDEVEENKDLGYVKNCNEMANTSQPVDNSTSFFSSDSVSIQTPEAEVNQEGNMITTPEFQIVDVIGKSDVVAPSLIDALEAARTLRRFYKLTPTTSPVHLKHLYDIEEDLENEYWFRKKINKSLKNFNTQTASRNFED
ncbi:hypothetical protein CHUAL_011132 [Chamberlinius hualienensis]